MDNIYVLSRELREKLLVDSDEEIWIWTVNGKEISIFSPSYTNSAFDLPAR